MANPEQKAMSVGYTPLNGGWTIASRKPTSRLGKMPRPLVEEMQRVAQDRGAIHVVGAVSESGKTTVFDPGPLNPTKEQAAEILDEPGPFGQQ